MYCKLNSRVCLAYISVGVFTPLFNRSRVNHGKSSSASKKYKAYMFQHVVMAKEIANMVAIRIIYRKHVIKAGTSDLRICTVLSCIPYSHIHQSQQPFLSHCIFYDILAFLLKHTFFKREGYQESGLV
jgi:hypothetical protein